MMRAWCRQVNWGNCGIPWVNCTVLCVKDDWKGQFWGLRYCLSKPRSLLSFFRQVWRHSKIAQFNWACIGRYTPLDGADKYPSHWVQRWIHFVVMIREVRMALRTAISSFTNIISRLLSSTEDAVCFVTRKGRLLQRLNRCAYEGYLSNEFKAWDIWRKMQSVKDSKTRALYNNNNNNNLL